MTIGGAASAAAHAESRRQSNTDLCLWLTAKTTSGALGGVTNLERVSDNQVAEL